MKTTTTILAALGALASRFFGMTWLSGCRALGELSEFERMAAQSMAAAQGKSLDKMGAAAIILVIGALAGGLATGAGLLPAFVASESVVFTALLILAGGLAFYTHSKREVAAS